MWKHIGMRRHFAMLIVALTTMAYFSSEVCCSRDGFNMYKDLLLRGKFDEVEDGEEQIDTKGISITPKLLYGSARDTFENSIQPTDMEPDSEENSESSALKEKVALSQREAGYPYAYSRLNTRTSEDITGLTKRGPGSFLTWALSSKRPLTQHSGSGGPTAFIATMGKREHSLQ